MMAVTTTAARAVARPGTHVANGASCRASTPTRAPAPCVRVQRRAALGVVCGCSRVVQPALPRGSGGRPQRRTRLGAMAGVGDAADGEEAIAALDDKTLRELRRLEDLAQPIMELRSSARIEALQVRCCLFTSTSPSLLRLPLEAR